jgi:Ca2+-transporting ATPase
LTIILAIGVQRMATRRAIIRKLPAVETLGSTTVICTDKTGTLTENAMTVVEAWSGGRSYSLSGTGYAPEGMIQLRDGASQEDRKAACDFVVDAHPSLGECLVAGLLCNDSRVFLDGNRWTVHGDPTEGALLVAAGKAGVRAEDRHHRHPRLDTLPFESEHQYMGTLHDGPSDGSRMAYIKGAVEKILARCDSMLDGFGEQVPLDAAAVQSAFSRMAAQGLRVLAFARRAVPDHQTLLHHADLDQGLTFLGLQGMIDPPRQEALRAVAACQSAGVRVKMITGDHALTARAIAKKIGILQEGEPGHGVAAGTELARLTDDELLEVAERLSVFARVTPQQKLRLVCALQKRGHVVAMTGDGVNDAPALTQADIGVSMGITGTEVAKESADMVLTDDNFASIAAAVEEGRGVFDNLTKFILWTLPTNMGEGLVVLAATLAGTALPILPIQILWINMTTAVLLGLTLAFEPKEPGIMSRAPRSAATPILTDILIGRILMVSMLLLAGAFGLFQWMLADGRSEAVARTVTVNVFVFVQIFYLLNCRSMTQSLFHVGLFSNPWVWLGIAGMTLLQLLYTYTAPMNRLFESSPILATDWIMILAVAVIAFAIVGAEKWLRLQMAR